MKVDCFNNGKLVGYDSFDCDIEKFEEGYIIKFVAKHFTNLNIWKKDNVLADYYQTKYYFDKSSIKKMKDRFCFLNEDEIISNLVKQAREEFKNSNGLEKLCGPYAYKFTPFEEMCANHTSLHTHLRFNASESGLLGEFNIYPVIVYMNDENYTPYFIEFEDLNVEEKRLNYALKAIFGIDFKFTTCWDAKKEYLASTSPLTKHAFNLCEKKGLNKFDAEFKTHISTTTVM